MWSSHYYRGSNPCKCLTKVLNQRLHRIWTNMKTRCLNVNYSRYKDYGARGISICKEWMDYKTFEHWALQNGYTDNLTIDRIDVNRGYCPENCRWVNTYIQANNKTNNIKFVIINYQASLRRICEIYGLNYHSEYNYYSTHGYDEELLILTQKINRLILSYDEELDCNLPFLEEAV